MGFNSDFDKDGFAIMSQVIDATEIADLIAEMQQEQHRRDAPANDRMYALRNLFQTMPSICRLAASQPVRALVEPFLGSDFFAARALYFDKLPDANWKVPWHQDLSVALAVRRDVEGFGPWSYKAGVLHAQAPVSLLERMVTLRLHLDACPATNGPLCVLPGTHRHGKLNPTQITVLRSQVAETVCEVECGGALLMRPLLLHASSAAESPNHRRVIHIEYANTLLPDRLEWHEVVSASSC